MSSHSLHFDEHEHAGGFTWSENNLAGVQPSFSKFPNSGLAAAQQTAMVRPGGIGADMILSRRISILILILSCAAGQAEAFTVNTTPLSSTRKDMETLGKGVAIALPVAAAGIAWFKT